MDHNLPFLAISLYPYLAALSKDRQQDAISFTTSVTFASGFKERIYALFYKPLRYDFTSFPNIIYAEAGFLGGTALVPRSFNFYIYL